MTTGQICYLRHNDKFREANFVRERKEIHGACEIKIGKAIHLVSQKEIYSLEDKNKFIKEQNDNRAKKS